MRDSSLSALFGALSNEMRMSTIANNLANVNTTAYKKDTMAFHDVFTRFAHDNVVSTETYLRGKEMFPDPKIMAKTRLAEQQVDFTQGSLQKTGNQLDFALSGEGFFKVQSGEDVMYTRAGNFLVDANGVLVTQQGDTVLVDGGPLVLPPGATLSATSGGTLSINGEPAGSFDLATFEDLGPLERAGGNKYLAPEGAAEAPPGDLEVQQGFLEKGNVEVVTEMVEMLETQRAFEMYSKMLTGTDQLDRNMILRLGRIT
ncbi:flagellar hook-basal body protein [uncultured Pseudodesulfovibrio sp.]|uniref:flagellar hook-basal body protein n=1 Tax=uncultured Pseudodesulfovibrio sp. TaxID=2035858 RepID=UPI0029C9B101|nr:flagellar hook-basal body protein [uncultured Pseudodesulfovibrio sp.]